MENKYNFKVITEYQQISDLITAHLKKGVRTNTAMSREEYEWEIANRTLAAVETPSGLVMLRRRFSRIRMNYYFNDTGSAVEKLDGAALMKVLEDIGWESAAENGCDANDTNGANDANCVNCVSGAQVTCGRNRKPIVVETAFRERDAALKETVEYLAGCGFKEIVSRVRLSRAAGDAAEVVGAAVRKATPDDAKAVKQMLFDNFSAVTGCLPEDEELAADIAAGRFLMIGSDALPEGLLHFGAGAKSADIRHLVVRADARGRGLSFKLINAFIKECGGVKASVWTGSENHAALNAYKDCGFKEDGRRSSVMIFER